MIAYKLPDSFDFNGVEVRLCLAFDVVLRFYDIQKDDRLSDLEKLNLSLEILVENYKDIKKLSASNKTAIMQTIFNDFVSIKSKPSDNTERLYDFTQDAGYIYSSFYMDYGIDLQEMRGKLDWRKFIALFQGLSERTKMHEVMNIRAKKIPAPTKYNRAEISNLQKLKAYYALYLTEDEMEQNFKQSLNRLADKLCGIAKGR